VNFFKRKSKKVFEKFSKNLRIFQELVSYCEDFEVKIFHFQNLGLE